ncbi:hypothetical protein SDC9_73374 [bioreactor metagenome]|uniref:Uncharacterized protein n=1 Tax=bioreactor metagenome TaxID=1076179 RepID=A0A644YEW5_9ZZZZ
MNTEESNSVERGARRRKAPPPVRGCFAGAGESVEFVPPTSHCSTEDRVRIRAKLRLTFACRRKTDTEEPNSVEKGAHRMKAPAPVRVCFAGAGSRANIVPPGSRCSTEDSLRPRAQLRPTFSRRRKMGIEEPNSVEKGTHRRKAPAPVRVCFAGADESEKFVPPGRHRSSEDRVRPRAQLRPTFACRRKTNTEGPTSGERGAHRRKAPVPVRVCFAGAGESAKSVPPASPCSSEDKLRVSAQLRLTFACRRKMDTEEHNSVEKGAHRRKAPAPVRVCFAGACARWRSCPPIRIRSTEDRV